MDVAFGLSSIPGGVFLRVRPAGPYLIVIVQHGPWRWLFIVEGILTIVIVPCFFFMFPQEPRTAWFLTEEEKTLMNLRYASDPHWGIDEKFKWSSVFSVLADPKWYAL